MDLKGKENKKIEETPQCGLKGGLKGKSENKIRK